jgi:hypothetical protein
MPRILEMPTPPVERSDDTIEAQEQDTQAVLGEIVPFLELEGESEGAIQRLENIFAGQIDINEEELERLMAKIARIGDAAASALTALGMTAMAGGLIASMEAGVEDEKKIMAFILAGGITAGLSILGTKREPGQVARKLAEAFTKAGEFFQGSKADIAEEVEVT